MESKVMGYMNRGTLICFVLLLFTISGCVGLSSGYGVGQPLNNKVESPRHRKKAELKETVLKNAETVKVPAKIAEQPASDISGSSGLGKKSGITGGSLADLKGYQPVQIVDTHVPFSRKYKKDKNKHHVELAFDNADIYEVLDATLFDIFGINYIVDPHIRAKVTFHFKGDYSDAQFIELLNNVLQMDNLAIVKGLSLIHI